MVAKKDGEEYISLSKNLIVKKRPRQKMGLFLDSQENATCDKISFSKQAPTSKNNQLLGQSQRSPKILCIKNVSESEPRKQHQGHLNMRIDQEKISQCCNRK